MPETHLHMNAELQGLLSLFTKQRSVMPSLWPSDRSRKEGRRMACAHPGSHHWMLCYNNLPVWVMLTIIRQTGCQTIVRKAVKHFVLLSPEQACDLSLQKKHIKKKKFLNSDILFKFCPLASLIVCRVMSHVGCNAQPLVPSLTEWVSRVGASRCQERWRARDGNREYLWTHGKPLASRHMKKNNWHSYSFLRFLVTLALNLKYSLRHQGSYPWRLHLSPPKTLFGVLALVKVYFEGFDLFSIKSNFLMMSPMAVSEPERKSNGNNTFPIQFL